MRCRSKGIPCPPAHVRRGQRIDPRLSLMPGIEIYRHKPTGAGCRNARRGHVWVESSTPQTAATPDGDGPPGSVQDPKKSRPNPGPMSLAGFGDVWGIFMRIEPLVEDFEGKSNVRALGALG